jgi:pimeloyl-ACP methyl ester carboxylesterase
MSTFLLIPGAGGMAWYWHLVEERLGEAGHEAIALDLPAEDLRAGLTEYVNLALSAVSGREDLVVVGQSMGAFTAVPVCERLTARRLALLNAMIPLPAERAGDWWEHTGAPDARRAAARAAGYPEAFDAQTYFLHDVPPEVLAGGPEKQRDEADIAFEEPAPFAAWPDVRTTVLAGQDDRFFPIAFQQRVARERLGAEAQLVPGGHLAALSHPEAITRALLEDE